MRDIECFIEFVSNVVAVVPNEMTRVIAHSIRIFTLHRTMVIIKPPTLLSKDTVQKSMKMKVQNFVIITIRLGTPQNNIYRTVNIF